MLHVLADRISAAQLMLALMVALAAGLLWRERKDSDRLGYMAIGLCVGIAIGHLLNQ